MAYLSFYCSSFPYYIVSSLKGYLELSGNLPGYGFKHRRCLNKDWHMAVIKT